MFAPPIAKLESVSRRSAIAAQLGSQAAVARGQLLQRTIGNQALTQLLTQRAGATPEPTHIQAKLKIGAVDDPLEHEADQVADQVMRMSASQVSVAAAPPQVSRQCAECEEEGRLQRSPGRMQATTTEAPASVHEVLRSAGQLLDATTRSFFEPRFGHDFSQVRVHTGAQASESANSVRAQAYTVGSDVVFGAGQYAPGTTTGRKLLAHELTHVIQQDHSPGPKEPTASAARSVPEYQAKGSPNGGARRRIAKDVSRGTSSGLFRRGPTPAVGVVPAATPYAVAPDPTGSQATYRRSQWYGATARMQAASRSNPMPVLRSGGAPPDFITKSERQPHESIGPKSGTVFTELYEFHVVDAIEYWTERATNAQQIYQVLRRYMPDVVDDIGPLTGPTEYYPPTPGVEESMVKVTDPGAKIRREAFRRGYEKRRQRLEAAVLAEAENVALTGAKRRLGPCYERTNPPKNRHVRHNAYARHVATEKGYGSVTDELTWTTPEGVSYSFDTYNPKDRTEVWEVKTQHEWASPTGMANAPYRVPDFSRRVQDLEVQRLKGLYIASRCGLRFRYAFDNCSAYTGFRQAWMMLPPLEYIPYPGEAKVDCP